MVFQNPSESRGELGWVTWDESRVSRSTSQLLRFIFLFFFISDIRHVSDSFLRQFSPFHSNGSLPSLENFVPPPRPAPPSGPSANLTLPP